MALVPESAVSFLLLDLYSQTVGGLLLANFIALELAELNTGFGGIGLPVGPDDGKNLEDVLWLWRLYLGEDEEKDEEDTHFDWVRSTGDGRAFIGGKTLIGSRL